MSKSDQFFLIIEVDRLRCPVNSEGLFSVAQLEVNELSNDDHNSTDLECKMRNCSELD